MASASSSVAPVKVSEKQGRASQKSVQKYYKTEVTTLADGSVKRETFRTDAQGNNTVKINEVTADKDGNITNDTTLSTATEGERKALQNPDSQLRSSIRDQTKEAGDEARANSVDPGGDKATDKAGGGSGNNAKNPEQGDSQSSPEAEKPAPPQNLRYPATMAEDQDVIQFTALTYKAKEIKGFSFGARERVTVGGGGPRSVGTVTLPIQSGIKDNNAAGWADDKMNPAQMAMAGAALGGISEGIKGFTDQTGKALEQFKEDAPNFKTATTGIFAAQAAGVQNLLARTEGKVINPNLELLFKEPSLRPFNFSFRLSPRSAAEAETVVQIIRFFKKNMSPQKGDGGSGGAGANLFLKAPNTFQVHYLLAGGEEHKYIGMMKECAMTGFQVDYTPENNYATLKDGYMASYVITMTLKELEPVFTEDYDGDDVPTDAIGF